MKKNLGFDAEEYAKVAGFHSDWRDLFWSQDYLELLARRWRLPEAPRILDVGCGAGHWGQRLATLVPAPRVTGVDHEAGFLELARERAQGRRGEYDYRIGDAEALPFEDDAFDVVTCHTVLMHVADARPVVAEMKRVTRPGGLVVTAEPNNLINLMVRYAGLPAAPFETTLRRLAFDHTCLEGKRALGQGDNAVGERLGALLTEVGLEELSLQTNERCSWLVPPYDTGPERTSIDMIRTWVEHGITMWGDASKGRELYLAGGGDAADFDALWRLLLDQQLDTLSQIDAGEHVWGGAHVMYVATGRKG